MNRQHEGALLVLNVGSSTLKFGVFRRADGDDAVLKGVMEYSRASVGRLTLFGPAESKIRDTELDVSAETAPAEVLRLLERESLLASVEAVGHRLVHGGAAMREPVRIDAKLRALLEQLVPLAPDHLPIELRAIDEITRIAPNLVQVACFDTAFHSTMPTVAKVFGLPRSLSDSGVVRYGFHGLSYEFVVHALRERGDLRRRTIIAHLGSGASVVALLDGASVDTSMGLTPAGGVVMSTRSGDLDPGVLLYLLSARNFSLGELNQAVNERGGLLGISDSSADVRELLASAGTDARAAEAIDVFCYQVRKFIGAYAAALGGIDALVFTGGIGEHSAEIRTRICEKLAFLGVHLQADLNDRHGATISRSDSEVAVHLVNTNEEAMIARHLRSVLLEQTRPASGTA